MINITQGGWQWEIMDSPATCPQPDVWHRPSERVSELLGPDGEHLHVPYSRNSIGFDLTPKQKQGQ